MHALNMEKEGSGRQGTYSCNHHKSSRPRETKPAD
jgi:hypothetical protein